MNSDNLALISNTQKKRLAAFWMAIVEATE